MFHYNPILKKITERYEFKQNNLYIKPYLYTNIIPYHRRKPNAKRYLTPEIYLYSGKYQLSDISGDLRLGFLFPTIGYDELKNKLLDLSVNYKHAFYISIVKICLKPTKINFLKYLEISSEECTDFNLLVNQFWKKTYHFDSTLKDIFINKQPIIPVISLIGNMKITFFSTYSILSYRWNDIISYALHKFLLHYKDKYIPFTEASHVEYFFNSMKDLLQEGFLYYRAKDTELVWSESIRFSWCSYLSDDLNISSYTYNLTLEDKVASDNYLTLIEKYEIDSYPSYKSLTIL